MQRRTAVVVGGVDVHAARDEEAHLVKVALCGRPTQSDAGIRGSGVLAQSWVDLARVGAVNHVVECMEVEARRQFLAELDTTDAVAVAVEGRGPDTDAEHARDNHHERPRDAALGRQSDRERELAGVVVEAAR